MKVFRDLFIKMGMIGLWYVGIFAVVMIVLQIIFKAAGIEIDVTLMTISEFSTRIWLIVIGVVYPLVYFNYYLEVGVTRKQFAIGLFAAGSLMSLCFSVLRISLLITNGEFSFLAVLVPALYGALSLLLGWTAAVGFQYMRGIPILISIVCATAMFHGMVALERLKLPTLAHLPIAVCAIIAVGALLLRAVTRIPVKC